MPEAVERTEEIQTEPVNPQDLMSRLRVQQSDDTVSPEHLNSILSLVEDQPNLARHPEVQKILELANGIVDEEEKNPTEPIEPKSPVEKKPTEPAEPKPPVEKKATTPVTDDLSFLDDIPFFKNIKANNDVKDVTFEKLPDHIEKVFGINIKEQEGLEKYLTAVNKFRKDSGEYAKTAKDLADVQAAFAEMPVQLRMLFESWNSGKYTPELLNSPIMRFDFEKPFENQSLETILRFYHPDEQFEPEDFKDKGLEDSRMKALVRTAKTLYNTDKQTVQSQRAKLQSDATDRKKSFDTSVESSVQALQSEYPDFGSTELESVRAILSGNRLGDLFFSSDGKLRQDAAKRIALAKYGDSILKAVATRTLKKETTDNNLKKVKDAKTAPEKKPKAPAPEAAVKSWASDWTDNDPYASRKRTG